MVGFAFASVSKIKGFFLSPHVWTLGSSKAELRNRLKELPPEDHAAGLGFPMAQGRRAWGSVLGHGPVLSLRVWVPSAHGNGG